MPCRSKYYLGRSTRHPSFASGYRHSLQSHPSTNVPFSQKFQSIKRTVKPANPDGTTASKPAKATKPKPSTSSGTATKTRKRKANVNEDDDDDEGATLFTPMAQKKMKSEKKVDREAEVDGIGAEIFKAEAGGEGIDLECDEYVLLTPLSILLR